MILAVDIETYSSADLKKEGLHKYVQSSDFEIMLFAYSYDGGEVKIVDLSGGEKLPPGVIADLKNPAVTKKAFNAVFEWTCLSKFYETPLYQWECTMVHSLYCGLTTALGSAGAAAGLPQDMRKMGIGGALIRTFCCPVKPTASNGQRTRTYPHHEPDKWNLFKEYCKQDVVAEMTLANKLKSFPVPEFEHTMWLIDQSINLNGVLVDTDLLAGALYCDAVNTEELIRRAVELTGVNNPKSRVRLLTWLCKELDEGVPDLTKDTVKKLLGKKSLDDTVEEVLRIRQELAKTSVSKYKAIERNLCADGRIRGLVQFYGANRSGRWAGRAVQIQNLPKNFLEPLSLARDIVKGCNVEGVKLIYGDIPNTLSQLIRTIFIPPKGKLLAVADFSAIEARIISWLAGEKWRMDVFATHGKIYEASASAMFNVPIETIVKGGANYDLRAKGKVAELACTAYAELVTTDIGLVPIQDVTTDMKVWDGEEWVKHDGVIYQGVKEVMYYDGLWATPDHLVFVEGQEGEVRLDNASESRQRLLQSRPSREKVWLGSYNKPRKKVRSRVVGLIRSNAMHRLCIRAVAIHGKPEKREIERMSDVFSTEADTFVAGPKTYGIKAEVRESKRQELRSEGGRVQIQERNGSRVVGYGELGHTGVRLRIRQNRQQRALRSWKFKMGYSYRKQSEYEKNCFRRLGRNALALRKNRCFAQVETRVFSRKNIGGRKTGSFGETQELEKHTRKARVYDILNCGPHNRFTVSGVLVHNCGYQGSVGALKAMGAEAMGLSDAQLQEIIDAWRAANPNIVKLWYGVQDAAINTIKTGRKHTFRGLVFAREMDFKEKMDYLTILLPSQRKLFYAFPKLGKNKWGGDSIEYMGMNQTNKKWERIETYGGKLVENCIAFGTPVLTEDGWVEIQNVSASVRVWDGVEWVRHSGVVCKGEQQTINAHGVELTPEHGVLTEKGWICASQSEGFNRAKVQLPNGYKVCWKRRELDVALSDSSQLPKRETYRYPRFHKQVFDLLDCGPRHRFVVLGNLGPVIVHNCTQAIARDCLAHAIYRLRKVDKKIVMHVHDEVVLCVDNESELKEICDIMGQALDWAPGLILTASGFVNNYYKKD